MEQNGAKIIIDFLIAQGCDTVFGYPGGQVLKIFDALYDRKDRITHIITAHEQGASHAADGYARSSGRPGVVIATSGPGSTNIITGLATAYLDSVPVIAITGNVPTFLLGRDSFQEVNTVEITRTVTKRNWIVKDVTKLAHTLREAWQTAISGRPGPVLIDIPADVQSAVCEAPIFEKVEKLPSSRVSESYLEAAALMINKSKKPYIYLGGGVISADAGKELLALSEKLDAPMGSSLMGLSAVPYDTPRFLGMQGMHGRYAASKAEDEADLVIAAGVRFSDRATGNKNRFAKNFRIIHIDVDSKELNKNIPADITMEGDIKDALSRLLPKLEKKSLPEWQERIKELREEEETYTAKAMGKTPEGFLNPYRVIDVVSGFSEGLPVATDVGQHQMWTAQRYPHKGTRTFLTSGGLGTMGFGMGAAIAHMDHLQKAHTVHQLVELFRRDRHDDLVFIRKGALLLAGVRYRHGVVLLQIAAHQSVDAGIDAVELHVQQLAGLELDGHQERAELEVVVAVDEQHVRLETRLRRGREQHALDLADGQPREIGKEPRRLFRILHAHERADDLEGLRAGGAVCVAESDDRRPAPLGALVRIERLALPLNEPEGLAEGEMAVNLAGDLHALRQLRRVLDELDRLDVQLQIERFLQPQRGLVVFCHVRASLSVFAVLIILQDRSNSKHLGVGRPRSFPGQFLDEKRVVEEHVVVLDIEPEDLFVVLRGGAERKVLGLAARKGLDRAE